MNFDQLANLIKAGFNEEQIRSIGSIMDTGTSTNTGTNTGTNTNTPAPTTTALPTPTVTPAPGGTLPSAAPSTTPPATPPATTTPPAESGGTDKKGGTLTSAALSGESETVTLLKEMLGIIQKGNINTVGTGTAAQETGVDVLAEILNPTPKK